MFRLSKAFPQQPIEFFDILLEVLLEMNLSENDLTDMINRCIRTFEYKNLTVAAVIKNEKQVYIIPED